MALRSVLLFLCLCLFAQAARAQATPPGNVVFVQQLYSSMALIPGKPVRSFRGGAAIAIDRFQNVYVSELDDNGLFKLSPTGDSLRAVIGTGMDHYQFDAPQSIDARLSNVIFIADRFNHRIEQYTKDLAYVSTLYTFENPDHAKQFGYPQSVAADDAGNIYVADGENKRVLKFRSDYSLERAIGSSSESSRPDALLTNPIALAIDANQHLLVLDRKGRSLVQFDNLGNQLHRTEVEGEGCSISTSGDTVFVLTPEWRQVRLYRNSDLTFMGAWDIKGDDGSSLRDFQTRNGTAYLLTRKALYRCTLEANQAKSVGGSIIR